MGSALPWQRWLGERRAVRQPAERRRLRACAAGLRRTMVERMAVSTPASGVPLDMRDFTARYTAAWNACDTAAMAELISEDVVWADPALPAPARGVAEVQEFMRTSFRSFPDLRFGEPDPPSLAVSGDVVFWAWYMEGTHRGTIDPPGFAPTGQRMRVDGVDHWTMRDGRIALLPRLLRHERRRPPARHRAGRRAAAPSAEWSPCSVCRPGSRGDERRLGRRALRRRDRRRQHGRAARRRGSSPSAARAWR